VFETKPPSVKDEFREIREIFDGVDLACVVGRTEETISRWSRRDSFPVRIERFLDDLWTATAIVYREIGNDRRVRFVLTSRREEFDWRTPIEVIFAEGFISIRDTLSDVTRREAQVDSEEPLPVSRLRVPDEIPPAGSRSLETTSVSDERRANARAAFLHRAFTHEGLDEDALEELRENKHAVWQ
jgi:hypothetical protein